MTTTLTVDVSRNDHHCQIQASIEEADASAMKSRLRQMISVCEDTLDQRLAASVDRYPVAQPSSPNNGSPRLATEKQVNAIHAMAKRQGIELSQVLHDRFSGKGVTDLSIRDASQLIDELKGNSAST